MAFLIHYSNGSEAYLSHHGIKGMKWGVHNEETKIKYGENQSSSPGGGLEEDEEDKEENEDSLNPLDALSKIGDNAKSIVDDVKKKQEDFQRRGEWNQYVLKKREEATNLLNERDSQTNVFDHGPAAKTTKIGPFEIHTFSDKKESQNGNTHTKDFYKNKVYTLFGHTIGETRKHSGYSKVSTHVSNIITS